MPNPYGKYVEKATGKVLDLPGSLGEQNLAANKMEGVDWVPNAPAGSTGITTIQQGSPVISSKDNQQSFREDSGKIDTIAGGLASAVGIKTPTATGETKTTTATTTATPTGTTETKTQTPFSTGDKNAAGTIETTGDPVRDSLNKWEKDQANKLAVESEARKQSYSQLFTTSLSAIDAAAKATIDRVNLSYDKRLQEQNRINQINIDRVKAYGLTSGGQYTPIAFGDAISLREQEASDKISSLDSERNNLISQAQAARDQGASKLLREKLADLDKIDSELRTQLANVDKESNDQYTILKNIRIEEEKKHQDAVTKMRERLSSLAPQYAKDYSKLSPAEKDAFIKKITEQTGLDYATIYSTLEGALTKETTEQLDIQKKKADIGSVEALTLDRKATAAKSFADAAVKSTEKKTEALMSQDVPATFATAEEAATKRMEFVKKYGTAGGKYWDDVFAKDKDTGDYSYPLKEAATAIKTGVEEAKKKYNLKY
jgi:hypothetical protein